ncbi:MAG: hypothetical protein JXA72_02335 [Bacteroidales bacterium]|nr:hypothetical protein [Bacteroidales bacterium]
MKRYIYTPVLVMLLAALTTLGAQGRQDNYLGLPGDNLNLYAVMKLFQESETLEGFERSLNDENSRINNLDLDGNGYVDYIRVIDNVDKNVHYIVLQVAINARENQDVAVFTVVQRANNEVEIQLIGDEDLYGKNYIIEPIYAETPNPGYKGNARVVDGQRVVVNHVTTVEVAAWPLIRFMFLPTYVVWHSPWYYSYYPNYWRPWSPWYWHQYYGYHYHYHSYYYGRYHHWNEYRHPHYHSYYYGSRRTYSPAVRSGIHDGRYKSTYSRPESREQGSAAYYQANPDRRAATSGNRTGASSDRRAGSQVAAPRQSGNTSTGRQSSASTSRQTTGSGTARRPEAAGTSRQSTGTATQRQSGAAGTTRQSTGTTTERRQSSASNTRQTSGTATQRQPAATSPSRQSATSPSRERTSTASPARKSSTTQSAGQSRRSGSSQSTGVQRSSQKSSVSSSGRSSGSSSRSSGTSRSSGRSAGSGSSGNSDRR